VLAFGEAAHRIEAVRLEPWLGIEWRTCLRAAEQSAQTAASRGANDHQAPTRAERAAGFLDQV
jgi:hypothetical protein